MVVLVALTTLAMTARQNHLAELHSQFSKMEGDVREVKLHLEAIAREMSEDARFLTSLPPVQGIIDAADGAEGDSKEVWRARLEAIFFGMLGLNEDYLALSLEAKQGEGATDMVRVERSPADPKLIRILPLSRHLTSDTSTLMALAANLEPGDVKLTFYSRTHHGKNLADLERFFAITPVFGEASGEFFGMTVIEADISKTILKVLRGLGKVNYELYFADGSGMLMGSVHPQRGIQMAGPSESLPDLPEQVTALLAREGQPFQLAIDDEFVAERFYIDPAGEGS